MCIFKVHLQADKGRVRLQHHSYGVEKLVTSSYRHSKLLGLQVPGKFCSVLLKTFAVENFQTWVPYSDRSDRCGQPLLCFKDTQGLLREPHFFKPGRHDVVKVP